MATKSEVFKADVSLLIDQESNSLSSSFDIKEFDDETYLFSERKSGTLRLFLFFKELQVSGVDSILFDTNEVVPDGMYEVICILAPERGKAIVGERPSSAGDFVHVSGDLHMITTEELESEFIDESRIRSLIKKDFHNTQQVFIEKVFIPFCSIEKYKKQLSEYSENILNDIPVDLIKKSEDCECGCSCEMSELPSKIAAYTFLDKSNFSAKNEELIKAWNIFKYKDCHRCCSGYELKNDNTESLKDESCEKESFILDAQKDLKLISLTIPDSRMFKSLNNKSEFLGFVIDITMLQSVTYRVYDSFDHDAININTGFYSKRKLIESFSDLFDFDTNNHYWVEYKDSKLYIYQKDNSIFDTWLFKIYFYVSKNCNYNDILSLFFNDLIKSDQKVTVRDWEDDNSYNEIEVSYNAWNSDGDLRYFLLENNADVEITEELLFNQLENEEISKFGTWRGYTEATEYKVVDNEYKTLIIKPILKQ